MQTDHDKDNDIPEFDFSQAQLARHRLRAGLETSDQYEERRALVNRAIAARRLLDGDIEETGGFPPGLLRELATSLARNKEFATDLLREIVTNSARNEEFAPGLLRDVQLAMTRLTNEPEPSAPEAIKEQLDALGLLLETAQTNLDRLRHQWSLAASEAAPSSSEEHS
jgi:hypothetical protein